MSTLSVTIINSNTSVLKKLKRTDNLSEIRDELENNIKVINTLVFLRKKDDDNYDIIGREDEEKIKLDDIIDKSMKGETIYLGKRDYWDELNERRQLDYGCTMTFNGFQKKKRAFIMKDCELEEIDTGAKYMRMEFNSKEDWMKKTNLFFHSDINIQNFVKLGLSVGSSRDKNFDNEINLIYHCIEYKKATLKFKYLEPTEGFIKSVENAINSLNPREKFKEIIKEYGQFIPTEVILGGRVYCEDIKTISENVAINSNIFGNAKVEVPNVSARGNNAKSKSQSIFYNFDCTKLLGGKCDGKFDEIKWIESLKDYKSWECIEFKNPVSIFKFLPDNLSDLRKRIFKSIGKTILCIKIIDCDYYLKKPGDFRRVELRDIPKNIIKDEEADCDIFASVVNVKNSKEVFFTCQIMESKESKDLIIHGIQKKFQPCVYKLKIGLMIIGYDTDFSSILSDTNVELLRNSYISKNLEFDTIKLSQSIERNIPFFGIPVLNKSGSSNLVIGHNFRQLEDDKYINIDIFSYSLKESRYVKLPNFTFCTLIVSETDVYKSSTFDFKIFKKPFIRFKSNSNSPKFVSLFSTNDHKPIFLNQKIKKINIEYVECNCMKTCFICKNKTEKIKKKEHDFCIIFDPVDLKIKSD